MSQEFEEQKFSNAEQAFAAYKKAADGVVGNPEEKIKGILDDHDQMAEALSAHRAVKKESKVADSGKINEEKISANDLRNVFALLNEGDVGFVDSSNLVKRKDGFRIELDGAARDFIKKNNFPFSEGFLFYAIFFQLKGDFLTSPDIHQINALAMSLTSTEGEYPRFQEQTQIYQKELEARLLEIFKKHYHDQLCRELDTHQNDSVFGEKIKALFLELDKHNLSYDDKNAILQVTLAAVDRESPLLKGVDRESPLLKGVDIAKAAKRVDEIIKKPGMSTLGKIVLGIVGLALIGLGVASAAVLGGGSNPLSDFGIEQGMALILQSAGTAIVGAAGVGVTSYSAVTFFKPPADNRKDLRAAIENIDAAKKELSAPADDNDAASLISKEGPSSGNS